MNLPSASACWPKVSLVSFLIVHICYIFVTYLLHICYIFVSYLFHSCYIFGSSARSSLRHDAAVHPVATCFNFHSANWVFHPCATGPHLKTKTTFRALKFVRMCQEIEICQILHLQYHGSINLQYIVKLYDDIFPEQPVQRRWAGVLINTRQGNTFFSAEKFSAVKLLWMHLPCPSRHTC